MAKRSNSIRALLAVLLATLFIPLAAFLAYTQIRGVKDRRAQYEAELLATADAASGAIRQFVLDSRRILVSLARDPNLRSLDPQRCPDFFPSLREIYLPTYTNLFTWTVDGDEICSMLQSSDAEPTVGTPPGLEDIITAQDFHISQVHEGTSTGLWTTGLSYPLRDQGGHKEGIITLSVNLGQFNEILARLEPPEGAWVISVLERDGWAFVARSRDAASFIGASSSRFQGTDPADGSPVLNRGIREAVTVEGEPFIWGYTVIPDTPWIVFAGQPKEFIGAPLRRRVVASTATILLSLLAAVLLGIWTYRRISGPLARLVDETSRARPGEPDPLSESGPHEIALLARRFNEAWNAWADAEKGRRRSIRRIQSMVENAVTGIYVSTQSGRFMEVNQAMVDLLGYESRDELLNTPVHELYPTKEERLEVLAAHGGKEFFRGVEVSWKKKDGTPLNVRLFGRRFRKDDGELAWEVIVEDVTRFRALQEQYLQAQKMEALGRMAGGVAHDFNNLLTVIQGQAELMLEDGRVGEDLKGQIREISEAAHRGANLNRQLLAFGRRGSGVREPLDLNDILSGFELVLRRAVGEETELQMAFGTELGWVLGNRGQMEQILMNLVVNARDAMPEGGSLLLETYNARVTEEEARAFPPAQSGPHVVLSVSDSGSGIDPGVLPNIFEPFFSTKPETEGTGLGLSTVYGIVTDMGGHIRVETLPDEGTTFRLFFPREAPGKEARPPARPEARRRKGSGLILLAEDEDAVRRLTCRILERAGYRVISARDGEEALALARTQERPVDILLSDVVMPGIRGPALAETLTREGKVSGVVLFSGYPEGLNDAPLDGRETWELLSKPFTSAELLAAVERALPRNR